MPAATLIPVLPIQARSLLLLAALALAWGCSGADPDNEPDAAVSDAAASDAMAADAGMLEVQAGSAAADGTGFVALDDGTAVTLVPGSQGGFHVWLNMRIRGGTGRLYVEREARRATDGALVYRGLKQPLDIPDQALDDWWSRPLASPAFMCPSPIGIQVYDQELVFEVRLLDENDRLLISDQLRLLVHCPADEQQEFCLSICAG